jgi:hypothetical protein
MDRRTFSKLITLGLIGTEVIPDLRAQSLRTPSTAALGQANQWPGQVYRRSLVDMHVPDWDPNLLSRFDPVDYVGTIANAGFQSLMYYAISCAGLCMWRTKVGQIHRGMDGRDYFGEIMDECSRRGLHRVAYFHVVYDNNQFEKHPDWRFQPEEGLDKILEGRYGFTCINSPARDYYLALARELVANYDFECIFNDMIQWPGVCYCQHCTARYWKEEKAEPPRVVDWDDPEWRAFQAARQRWMLEFAHSFTETVKSVRPVTVQYQCGALLEKWWYGFPLEVATQTCDFVGAHLAEGPDEYSLACKALDALTRTRPFEFMTSVTNNLRDHVTIKPLDELRIESFVPTIHSGAMLPIDAINPDGTLNHKPYEYLRKLNDERAPFEPFLGGSLMADVAVYCDKESMYNPDESGVRVDQLKQMENLPHVAGIRGAARILREAHIPYGVVTNATLDQLKNYRAVILPGVLEMTAVQAGQFRAFVEQGGALLASGPSSLDRFDKSGPRYLLEDLFGVRYLGKIGTSVTYLTAQDDEMKKALWPQNEIIFRGPMVKAEALRGASVLATVTLPYAPPESAHAIGSHFASIQSDPPAEVPGTDPGVVVNGFGRGKVLWIAASMEGGSNPVNGRLVTSLLKRVLPAPYSFEVDTHPSVEMTVYHQTDNRRLLAGLLNMQRDYPPIAVAANVRVKIPAGRRITNVYHIPDRKALPFEKVGPYVQFHLDSFPVIAMAAVEYE